VGATALKVIGRPISASILLASGIAWSSYAIHQRVHLKRKRAEKFNQALLGYAKYREYAEKSGAFLKEKIAHLLPKGYQVPKLRFKGVEIGQDDIEIEEYATTAMKLLHALIQDVGVQKVNLSISPGGRVPSLIEVTDFRKPRLRVVYQVLHTTPLDANSTKETQCPVCLTEWSPAKKPHVSSAHKIHPLCLECFLHIARASQTPAIACPICRDNINEISIKRAMDRTNLESLLGTREEFAPFVLLLNHSPSALSENFNSNTNLGGSGSKAIFSALGREIYAAAGGLLQLKHFVENLDDQRLLADSDLKLPTCEDLEEANFVLSYYTSEDYYGVGELDTEAQFSQFLP
jgi:hypothetical protein